MRTINKTTVILLICFVSTMLLPGCTNWKKKYQALNVEHQNLKGLYERQKAEKGQLAERASQDQQTIEDLQRQISERYSPAQATGFGEGYNVAVDAQAGTITVTLPNTILFDSGKADLKKSSVAELDHIRSVLQQKYSDKQIEVVGHTDAEPIKKSKWKDNWELSAQRALSVVRYLIKQGIPNEQIKAVGCGESRPVASNATAGGRAQNRRVEIVIRMR